MFGALSRIFNVCARRAVVSEKGTRVERPDHATRTAGEPRMDVTSSARISAVRVLTPDVREITLEIHHPDFSFHPGNWIDFIIPDVPKVGGYTISSTPVDLPRLKFAVKRSEHPPAAWCHSEACSPGVSVQVRAGGSVQWTAADHGDDVDHLLLIAGGIGISMLFSILQAAAATPADVLPGLQTITLLYSAARPSDLAYRDELEQVAKDLRVRLKFHITRNASPEEDWTGSTGRIGKGDLIAALANAGHGSHPTGALVYVCGPPAMTDNLIAVLCNEIGLPQDRVKAERWW